MALKDIVVDMYSALSHKAVLGDGDTAADNTLAPTWVPRDQKRRLDAYRVLAAYLNNVARQFLPASVPDADRKARREYGDPDLLVDRVMAGVLGDSVEIVVDGADIDLPDEPELPPEPQQPATDASPIAQRVFAVRHDLWQQRSAQIVDEWEAAWLAQPNLQARQAWLRGWADDELLNAKIVETERDIIGLADGVYVLAWSTEKQRPVVDLYDPGLYFPVLTDSTRDYPTKVHLAWEFEDADRHKFVRRLTWELAPIEATFDDFGNSIDPTKAKLVQGGWTREYPWNVDEQAKPIPSTVTCYFTDATWPLDDLGGRHADDLDLDNRNVRFATNENGTEARRLDLLIDFLPVVHVPNTPAHREHFGRSILLIIAQILDDLAASDTDVQAAAALAAGPVIHLAGAALPQGQPRTESNDPTGRHYTPTATGSRSSQLPPTLEVKPGVIHRTGAEGKMDVLDMSKGLAELRNVNKDLLDRLSVNARVPAEILGRVQGSQISSGVHLALTFGPFTQLIGVLRMAREPKYRLLLKFAQRLAMVGGVLEPGLVPSAHLALGSYLPSDRAQLVEQVTKLIQGRAISTQTAVALLVAGGFTIDDARGEVERIHYEHPEAAKFLADATGSEQAAADWLGIELPETAVPVPAPTSVLPPTPPAP